jgi:hypothetical protein
MDTRRKKLIIEPLEDQSPLLFEPIEQEKMKDVFLKEAPLKRYADGDIASKREKMLKFEGEEKVPLSMMDRMLKKYRSSSDDGSDSPEMKAARDMEHYSSLKKLSEEQNYPYGQVSEYEKSYGKGSDIDRQIASETDGDDEELFHRNPGKWKKLKALYNK